MDESTALATIRFWKDEKGKIPRWNGLVPDSHLDWRLLLSAMSFSYVFGRVTGSVRITA
jgi:hypothetical protein